MPRFLPLFALFLLAAVPGRASGLNQLQVHTAYNEGNFDYVIGTLEGFMKANKTFSPDDSIFIAKHLAVVYSANPATREKGRYYMNRLLELVPSAKLVDMYVSEEIDRIFDKVREEFLTRQRSFGIDQTHASLAPRPGAASPGDKAGKSPAQPGTDPKAEARSKPAASRAPAKLWFAAGVGVIAVAGTVAYFALHDEPAGEDRTFVVPR